MPRQLFTDDYWNKFKALLLSQGIYDKPSLRQTVEGIYYRLRVGYPWRDLPSHDWQLEWRVQTLQCVVASRKTKGHLSGAGGGTGFGMKLY